MKPHLFSWANQCPATNDRNRRIPQGGVTGWVEQIVQSKWKCKNQEWSGNKKPLGTLLEEWYEQVIKCSYDYWLPMLITHLPLI